MHLQVGVLEVEWDLEPLTLYGIRQRSRDVEVQRVTELVSA
jgi:hypothetical protein